MGMRKICCRWVFVVYSVFLNTFKPLTAGTGFLVSARVSAGSSSQTRHVFVRASNAHITPLYESAIRYVSPLSGVMALGNIPPSIEVSVSTAPDGDTRNPLGVLLSAHR